MSESDVRSRGISVTVKYGKGYEETWAGFTGSVDEVREDICRYFGIELEAMKDMTTSEVVVQATNVAHGKGNAAAVLGAMPVSRPAAQAAETAADKTDPWATAEDESASVAAEAAPVESSVDKAVREINDCASVMNLKLWWKDNQAVFADAVVAAAYSTRGKALKAAEQAAA